MTSVPDIWKLQRDWFTLKKKKLSYVLQVTMGLPNKSVWKYLQIHGWNFAGMVPWVTVLGDPCLIITKNW